MSIAVVSALAFYAAFTPLLFYGLWRHTWPSHRRRLPVPDVLGGGTILYLTTDTDWVGLV